MARGDRLAFGPNHRLAVVDVTLNRTCVALLADTGTELTIVSTTAVQRLQLELTKPLRMLPLVGVGRTARVPAVRVEQLQVGASLCKASRSPYSIYRQRSALLACSG